MFVDPKALLIGPGIYSDGNSELLSLPDLTPLDCNLPVFQDFYYGYVGRSTSDGVLMCGGDEFISETTSSCYLLTKGGYKEMQGLLDKGKFSTSVVTPLGLWVTGKPGFILFLSNYFFLGGGADYQYLDTTEIWSNNQSLID